MTDTTSRTAGRRSASASARTRWCSARSRRSRWTRGPDRVSGRHPRRGHRPLGITGRGRRDPLPRVRVRQGIRAGLRRLEGSALAHLPSGKCNANAAWLMLAVIAFNARLTPGRRDHHRRRAHQSHGRHDPPAHLRHPRAARDLREAHHHPPANRLAVEGLMAGDLRCDPRTTSTRDQRRRPHRQTTRRSTHKDQNDNEARNASPIGGFRFRSKHCLGPKMPPTLPETPDTDSDSSKTDWNPPK